MLTLIESLDATVLHAAELELTHPITGVRHVFKAPRLRLSKMRLPCYENTRDTPVDRVRL